MIDLQRLLASLGGPEHDGTVDAGAGVLGKPSPHALSAQGGQVPPGGVPPPHPGGELQHRPLRPGEAPGAEADVLLAPAGVAAGGRRRRRQGALAGGALARGEVAQYRSLALVRGTLAHGDHQARAVVLGKLRIPE